MPIEDKDIRYSLDQFNFTQIISIILKKLNDYSELLTSVFQYTDKEILSFDNYEHIHSHDKIMIKGAKNCKILVDNIKSLNRIDLKIILDSLKFYDVTKSLFPNIKNIDDHKVNVDGIISINFLEEHKKLFPKNTNMLINNINFFETSFSNNFLKTMLFVSKLSTKNEYRSHSCKININEFSKLNFENYDKLLEGQFNQKIFNILIDTLNFMIEYKVDNVRNYALTITYNIMEKKINIKLGGIVLFSGENIKKYNYINHAGLNIIMKYLELTDSYDRLTLMCQKKVFKKI